MLDLTRPSQDTIVRPTLAVIKGCGSSAPYQGTQSRTLRGWRTQCASVLVPQAGLRYQPQCHRFRPSMAHQSIGRSAVSGLWLCSGLAPPPARTIRPITDQRDAREHVMSSDNLCHFILILGQPPISAEQPSRSTSPGHAPVAGLAAGSGPPGSATQRTRFFAVASCCRTPRTPCRDEVKASPCKA